MKHNIIIICGNAGVGKTTYGRKLAAKNGAFMLDIDTVSERLVRAGLRASGQDPDDRDSPEYKRIYREVIHETLFAIAEDNLEQQPCILVAPFTQERRDKNFLQQCELRFATVVQVIYLHCDEEIRRGRIVSRNNPRDAQKLKNWRDYAAQGCDVAPPSFPHQAVDTATDPLIPTD